MNKLLLVLIIFSAFFLRFYRLSDLPPGLGRDEVSVGLNAYSILKTGYDEYHRFMPLYFEAIGDQKLPVIIYSTVPSIAAFGLTAFGARFPFALLGSLTVIFTYLFTRKAFSGVLIPLLAAAILTVNPWHLAHSRAVYEIVMGTFFFTAGTFYFLHGLEKPKLMIFSVLFFILAFYVYSMNRLLSPLLFLSYIWIYRKKIVKLPKIIKGISLFLVFFSLLPFIIYFFDPGGIYGPQGVAIFSSSRVRSSIMEFRSYVLNSNFQVLGPIFFNRVIMITYEYGKNLLAAISPEFFFAKGSDMAGIGTNGQFFMIEFIPFMIGLITAGVAAVKGNKIFRLLLSWIILPVLCASLTIDPPYVTRTFFIVVPMVILISVGWVKFFTWARNQRRFYFYLLITFVSLAYIWHLTFYFISYYVRFPVVYAKNWESKNKELFEYLEKEEDNVGKIVIEKPEYSMYAFYLFYRSIPPSDVWSKLERHLPGPDGWQHGKKIGKYEFRDIDWKKDREGGSVILVSRGGEYDKETSVTKEIFYPEKYTVFPYGLKVVALPEKRVAFRIWKFMYDEKTKVTKLVE